MPISTIFAHSLDIPPEQWYNIEKTLQGRVDRYLTTTIIFATIAIIEFILIAALVAILVIRAKRSKTKTHTK